MRNEAPVSLPLPAPPEEKHCLRPADVTVTAEQGLGEITGHLSCFSALGRWAQSDRADAMRLERDGGKAQPPIVPAGRLPRGVCESPSANPQVGWPDNCSYCDDMRNSKEREKQKDRETTSSSWRPARPRGYDLQLASQGRVRAEGRAASWARSASCLAHRVLRSLVGYFPCGKTKDKGQVQGTPRRAAQTPVCP